MERHFLDFWIDGKSLLDTLAANDFYPDFVSCFTVEFPHLSAESRDFLLLKKKAPDLEAGRVALYLCPECADLGCGVYTVLVSRQDDGYLWSDFSYENGYEEARPCNDVWSFFFAKDAYEEFVRLAISL